MNYQELLGKQIKRKSDMCCKQKDICDVTNIRGKH